MKKLLALTAAAGAAAALAIPSLAASTKRVKIGDDWFVRAAGGKSVKTVTIRSGTTVKWTWSGKHKHQVFQIGGPGHFHSPAHSKRGTTVKWTWSGKHKHQVFQIGGPGHFHSPAHSKRGTFRHKFTKKGTYKFVCPFQSMYMNVKVR